MAVGAAGAPSPWELRCLIACRGMRNQTWALRSASSGPLVCLKRGQMIFRWVTHLQCELPVQSRQPACKGSGDLLASPGTSSPVIGRLEEARESFTTVSVQPYSFCLFPEARDLLGLGSEGSSSPWHEAPTCLRCIAASISLWPRCGEKEGQDAGSCACT